MAGWRSTTRRESELSALISSLHAISVCASLQSRRNESVVSVPFAKSGTLRMTSKRYFPAVLISTLTPTDPTSTLGEAR